jgi:AhpD family alkylhydroperoxidase
MSVDSILSQKDREIINLGTSLAAGCQPCMKYHLRKCIDAGISEKEILEILNMAEGICTRAHGIMKLRALALVHTDPYEEFELHSGCRSRKEILVGLAVSYTVNSSDLTERYLACARQSKMSETEISGTIDLSKFAWRKARAHVDILIEGRGVGNQQMELKGRNCGCGC